MIPFAGSPLDRASEKRTDSKWIEDKKSDPSSLILPMWRLEPFLLGSEKSEPPVELGLSGKLLHQFANVSILIIWPRLIFSSRVASQPRRPRPF